MTNREIKELLKKSHYINIDFDGSDVEEIKGDVLIGFKQEHLPEVLKAWKNAQLPPSTSTNP